MIPTEKYSGSVQIMDGKIVSINIQLSGETLSDIRQIMALKHILENYIKDFERDDKRRI
jgi:hypothetical protein